MQLNQDEITELYRLAGEYTPAAEAANALTASNGNLESAFDQLWKQKYGVQEFGGQQSLFQVCLNVLRNDICGDKGFRSQIEEWTKKPQNVPLLTGLVVHLGNIAQAQGLPIDPALATVMLLYLSRFGLKVFCSYLQQPTE